METARLAPTGRDGLGVDGQAQGHIAGPGTLLEVGIERAGRSAAGSSRRCRLGHAKLVHLRRRGDRQPVAEGDHMQLARPELQGEVLAPQIGRQDTGVEVLQLVVIGAEISLVASGP